MYVHLPARVTRIDFRHVPVVVWSITVEFVVEIGPNVTDEEGELTIRVTALFVFAPAVDLTTTLRRTMSLTLYAVVFVGIVHLAHRRSRGTNRPVQVGE